MEIGGLNNILKYVSVDVKAIVWNNGVSIKFKVTKLLISK